jgi:ribosomal protein S18 acetylase RimI-like enzyme
MTAASEIVVRLATANDLPGVRALLVETWHDTYDTLLGRERVTEITNSWHSIENLGRQLHVPDASFLVAEESGAILGHAFANAQKPPLLVLSRLYVRPDRQRRGIGVSLLAAAVARHQECETIRLEVEADNTKGLSFYRREGFEAVGEKSEDGLNHILMEKRLTSGA